MRPDWDVCAFSGTAYCMEDTHARGSYGFCGLSEMCAHFCGSAYFMEDMHAWVFTGFAAWLGRVRILWMCK